jgi:hypothetical protein
MLGVSLQQSTGIIVVERRNARYAFEQDGAESEEVGGRIGERRPLQRARLRFGRVPLGISRLAGRKSEVDETNRRRV